MNNLIAEIQSYPFERLRNSLAQKIASRDQFIHWRAKASGQSKNFRRHQSEQRIIQSLPSDGDGA